jgi:flagellar protein FliO/FliZ
MNGSMRVISSVGVGQRERVVLLQVGEEQILVGVGPGNVRKIHAFDEPVVEPAASSTPNFSDVWKVAMGKSEATS